MSATTSEQASLDKSAGERVEMSTGDDRQVADRKFQEVSDELYDGSERAVDRLQELSTTLSSTPGSRPSPIRAKVRR